MRPAEGEDGVGTEKADGDEEEVPDRSSRSDPLAKLPRPERLERLLEASARFKAGETDPADERAFRRLTHAFGTIFLAFYLLPEDPPELRASVLAVGAVVLAAAIVVDGARLAGLFGRRRLYGLRDYEAHRPAAFVYWGLAALPLFWLAPEQIAIPCILCGALGDPLVGEARLHAGTAAGWAVAVSAGTVFFLLVGIAPWIAVLAGAAFAAGEGFKNPWLDDDLLTMAAPALVLAALLVAGAYAPVDVVTPWRM